MDDDYPIPHLIGYRGDYTPREPVFRDILAEIADDVRPPRKKKAHGGPGSAEGRAVTESGVWASALPNDEMLAKTHGE